MRAIVHVLFLGVLSAATVFADPGPAATAETPSIVSFSQQPTNLRQGEFGTFYLQLSTDFKSSGDVTAFLSVDVDGQTAKALHPTEDLWVLQSGPFLPGIHRLKVDVFIEPTIQANAIRKTISTLNASLADLQSRFRNEYDPGQRAEISKAIDAATTQLAELQSALSRLSKKIATEAFEFFVEAVTE
jgi:hypothetical protein